MQNVKLPTHPPLIKSKAMQGGRSPRMCKYCKGRRGYHRASQPARYPSQPPCQHPLTVTQDSPFQSLSTNCRRSWRRRWTGGERNGRKSKGGTSQGKKLSWLPPRRTSYSMKGRVSSFRDRYRLQHSISTQMGG